MNAILLDTTVASLLHSRKARDPLRGRYLPHLWGRTLALSFQAVAELWKWPERNRWGSEPQRELDAVVRNLLVIPYDYELARLWAELMIRTERANRRFSAEDCWIAATAIHRNLPLVTHDQHFLNREELGLHVISFVDT